MRNKLMIYFSRVGLTILLSGVGMVFSGSALAYCTPESGSPEKFEFSYNATLLKPEENKAGTALPRNYRWYLPRSIRATCYPFNGRGSHYFKATVPNLAPGVTIDRLNFHVLNNYLQVATEVYIHGRGYFPTPFVNVSNGADGTGGINQPFSSGSDGYISLYINRPFVGEVVIPRTLITELSVSFARPDNYNAPLSRVFMAGKVTVPQSCSINGGQIIRIPLGKINSRNISVKGKMPEDYIPKNVNLTIACKNISEGVNVSLSFNGQVAGGDVTALATSNEDVGIRILNANGQTVIPNQSELPVSMDFIQQTGSASMSVAPINVTGNKPESGPFTAVATMNVEMN